MRHRRLYTSVIASLFGRGTGGRRALAATTLCALSLATSSAYAQTTNVLDIDASYGGGCTACATGHVTVSGDQSGNEASPWTFDGELVIGNGSQGALTILNGGSVNNASDAFIGFTSGSEGTVGVDGPGSTWTVGQLLSIGGGFNGGQGTLALSNGGLVSASSAEIASTSGSVGTLIIGAAAGAAPVAPGTLDTPTVTFGTGTGAIVFNHTDTSGNYVFAPTISGAGAVNVYSGTTALTGNNSYTGGTTLHGGTLQLGNGGTSGAIVGDVTNDGTLAFDRSDTSTFAGTISGSGAVQQLGPGTTVLTSNNTYTGGTTISAGTLQLGNGGTSGAIIGDVLDNGTLAFNHNGAFFFDEAISGSGSVQQISPGYLILTRDNTYTGGTTISGGFLQVGNGGATGSIVGDVLDDGSLAFNRSDAYTFAGAISGVGSVQQAGPGTLTLTGASTYTGATFVTGGSLYVDGSTTSATTVGRGATLGGAGTIGGNVTVAAGATLAPGSASGAIGAIGALRIDGNLALASGVLLDYTFGQTPTGAAANDMIDVHGDLSLAGTVNIATTPDRTLDGGIYRLINYTGNLSGSGLTIGSTPVPAGELLLQTAVANQVNLIDTGNLPLNFWNGGSAMPGNGVIVGGSGVWQGEAGNTNWTDVNGSLIRPWADQGFALFQGTGGTVTVDNSVNPVATSGIQFAADGYVLTGAPLTLVETTAGTGQTTLRVGDGSTDGAGYTATINTQLDGDVQLLKTDLGTLVLNGANTYTGGTDLRAGTLQIAADANLGAAGTGLLIEGGTLHTTADLSTGRAVTLTGDGSFDVDAGTVLTLNGNVAGTGSLTKTGGGTLTLSGQTLWTGQTALDGGTLTLDGSQGGAQLTSNIAGTSGTLLSLVDGAALTGRIDSTDVSIDGASHWNIADSSSVNTLTLAGQANFVAPTQPFTQGRTLTVNNLVGQRGTVGLYTALGNSGSVTDQLVIDGGSATGLTHLNIINAGGLGDQTTGNGIPVVVTQNGGTTTATAFDLAGKVLAGPYQYSLQYGGDGAPSDWFLTSQVPTSGTGNNNGDGSSTGNNNGGGSGSGGNGGNDATGSGGSSVTGSHSDPVANYRPETSLYSALSGQALSYGEAMLGSLRDRYGAISDWSLGDDRYAWGRVLAQGIDNRGASQGLYDRDIRSNTGIGGIQVGSDLFATGAGAGRFSTGVSLGIGQSIGTIDHTDAAGNSAYAGKDTLRAYSAGLYGTWFTGQGGYVDGVLQGTRYNVSTNSVDGLSLRTHANGWAASLEAGQRFQLAPTLAVEPQAQVIYQSVGLNSSADQVSNVSFDRAKNALVRVGARLSHTLDTNGTPASVWLTANVLHNTQGSTQTRFPTVTQGAVNFANNYPGTRAQLLGGAETQVNPHLFLNAQLSAEQSIDNRHLTSFGGQMGVKLTW